MLTFTLLDRESGNEFSSHSMMINAVQKQAPLIPDGPDEGGKADPIDNGDSSPLVPDDGDEGPVEPADGQVARGSTSFSGVWVIIPAAVLLMLLGVGSYVLISVRKRGIKG